MWRGREQPQYPLQRLSLKEQLSKTIQPTIRIVGQLSFLRIDKARPISGSGFLTQRKPWQRSTSQLLGLTSTRYNVVPRCQCRGQKVNKCQPSGKDK